MDLRRFSPFLMTPFDFTSFGYQSGNEPDSKHRALAPALLQLVLATIFVTLMLFGLPSKAQSIDQVAVVVNKQVITALDLQRRERFLTAQMKRANQPLPDANTLSNAVLERAVLEMLMLQKATDLNLIPSDELVQQTIADNALQSGLDLNSFIRRIELSGVSFAEYTADLKNDMAITTIREKTLQAKVKVTDAEVDRFIKDPQSGIKQEFNVQALMVGKTEGASAAENARRREQALGVLLAAKRASTATSFAALQNNMIDYLAIGSPKHLVDLGYKTLDKLPEIYSSAIDNMAVGATSELLESSAGYYILRLNGKRSALPQVQQTKVRHILLRVPNPADETAAVDQIKRLHDRLTLNIDLFPLLAKQFSQDGSASAGGDLGWAMPGDMVPEFERMMDVLKEGEMALPLRTQFGWHVLQVLERKLNDLPQERLRARARNVLRAQKHEEALGEWLDQLKSQAYIEYKNEYKTGFKP